MIQLQSRKGVNDVLMTDLVMIVVIQRNALVALCLYRFGYRMPAKRPLMDSVFGTAPSSHDHGHRWADWGTMCSSFTLFQLDFVKGSA